MNILIISPELYPFVGGGVAMHVYCVSRLLARKPKYTIVLLSVCPKGMRCEHRLSDTELVKTVYLLPYPLASISYMVKSLIVFLLVKRKLELNIVHAHGASTQTMFLAYITCVLGKMPFLVTAHGSEVRVFKKARTAKVLQRFFLKKASYITCVSNEIKQILTREYGLEDYKISIIPNGYDDNFVSKRLEKQYYTEEKKIVFVGGLRPAKDPSTLLHAFKRIAIRHANVKLLIIGDGPLAKGLETLSKKLDISNQVSFYGQANHEKTMRLIDECDIYVLTSIDEGLPISLIEAMALGKPIIATNVGGVPEVVKNGVNGLLVPPRSPEQVAQAVELLLNEPELAQRLAAAATKSVQDYSWRRIVRKYEQIYEALTPKAEELPYG